jgi:hypothetical protein
LDVGAEVLDDGLVAQFEAQVVFQAKLNEQGLGLCVHQGGLAVHVA